MTITEHQSQQIRRLKAKGCSYRQIAREIGCSAMTAWRHCRGANMNAFGFVQRDTRSFTSRFFGDPVFERSAFYQKQTGGE